MKMIDQVDSAFYLFILEAVLLVGNILHIYVIALC